MRGLAAIAVVVALVAAAAATAGRPSERRYVVRGEGISLSLPSSWRGLSAREARNLLQKADELARENPQFAGVIAQLRRPQSPMKFFAFDPALVRGFATNVNVIVAPSAGSIPIGSYQRALSAQLRAFGVTNVRSARVRLPGGRAVRLTYRLTLKDRGQARTVAATQYAFPRPGRNVVVTYTTVPSVSGRYAPTFTASARSVRFGPS